MRAKLTIILATTLGLILSGGIVWGLYLLFSAAGRAFSSLDERLAAGLITAAATAIISVASILVAKYYERKAAIELELRSKKIPFYQNMIDLIFYYFYAEKLGQKKDDKEELLAMSEMTKGMVIWGSPEVVASYSEFRRLALLPPASNRPSNEVVFSIENILRGIRKDLGHNDLKLSKGAILRLFINDIDEYLTKPK